MAISGAEGMTDRQLAETLQAGGRIVVFSYCISVILITFRRSATVLVKPGQSVTSAGLPYTLISLFAGWWGFPFGLIFTPISIIGNLSGGKDVTSSFTHGLGAASALSALVAGRAVGVRWADGQTYRGAVVSASGGQVRVRFDNGSEQWVPAEYVQPV
jgi:hypothetical protein